MMNNQSFQSQNRISDWIKLDELTLVKCSNNKWWPFVSEGTAQWNLSNWIHCFRLKDSLARIGQDLGQTALWKI